MPIRHNTTTRAGFHEAKRFSESYRHWCRGCSHDGGAGNCAVDAGDQVALYGELAEVSLDTLWGGRRVVGADAIAEAQRQQVPGLRPFAGGEIVPGLQVLDAVQNGTVEMRAHGVPTTTSARTRRSRSAPPCRSDPNAAPATRPGCTQGGGQGADERVLQELQRHLRCLAGNTGCPDGRLVPQRRSTPLDDLKGLEVARRRLRRAWS